MKKHIVSSGRTFLTATRWSLLLAIAVVIGLGSCKEPEPEPSIRYERGMLIFTSEARNGLYLESSIEDRIVEYVTDGDLEGLKEYLFISSPCLIDWLITKLKEEAAMGNTARCQDIQNTIEFFNSWRNQDLETIRKKYFRDIDG
jgi:hypothetical protein